MNLKELKEIIFKPSSITMRKIGAEIYKNRLVSGVKTKKIDNIYHIYGDVLSEINGNQLKTHIGLNLSGNKVEIVSCTCNDFKENSRVKKVFMCEHLAATAYKFLNLVNKKKESTETTKDLPGEDRKKDEVDIETKITHKVWKGETKYELEFRIGLKHKHLITDLRNFISQLNQGKRIYFNNLFQYNPKEHIISSNSTKVLEFIKESVHLKRGISSTGRNIAISPDNLREFLKCICKQKVIFKYKGTEYKVTILNEDLPLNFTFKEREGHFILTTHKRLPIPLNENRDVYFFNNEVYLPSTNQIKKYSVFYDKLEKNGQILYRRTIENYNNVIYLLNSISKNITITEEVKRFAANLLKFEFLVYKEENNIYCDVYGLYNNKKINILEEHNKTQFTRDFNREEKVLMKFEYYKFIRGKDKLIFVGEEEDLFNFLNKEKNSIYSLGTVVLGRGLEDTKIYKSNLIELDLWEESGYLKLSYNIGNIESRELHSIFESYKSGNRFYKTKDNGFLSFEDKNITDFLDLVDILNGNNGVEEGFIEVEKNKAMYIAEKIKDRDYKFGKGINLLKDIEDKLIKLNSKELTVPKDLKATLRAYQVNGFRWLKSLSGLGFGGILADEMGLGKTVQTIAFLLSEEHKKSLIAVPTSLIYNWKDEIENFAPSLRSGIVHGNLKEQEKIINNLKDYDLILTTYGTLRNNINKYDNLQFDYFIIDEAQNIKNPSAQVTKVVKEIKAKVRFALTGTPIENNLVELWSIFDFIMPGYLYSKEAYYEKFIADSESDLEGLRLLIKPFILRRTKKEVAADLPDKIEKNILVQMTTAQKAIYNAYIKDIRAKIKNNVDGNVKIFSYLTKLRQICLDPSIIFDEYKGGSGKLKKAMSLIEENLSSGGKVLVFSQFTSVLKKIGNCLKENDIEYFYLDGATPSKERISLVDEFNSSEKRKVFLISLKAGGTGLNLTSANLVIHFDPWWNPAVENQATDRAHRIGQKSVVEVIKLIARETIEEKIISLQEHKRELIDNVVTGELKDSNTLNKLSREELIKIFSRN